MSTDTPLWIAFMLALVASNAFFVAIEFALVAVRPSRVQELVDSGNATARVLQHLQKNINTSVSGAQLGITLASLALGWVCEPSIHEVINWLLHLIPGTENFDLPTGVGMGLSLLAMSAFHAVLGEQVPKCTALRMPETAALLLCRPFSMYCRVVWPMIKALDFVTGVCLRLLHVKPPADHNAHSPDELEILFEQAEQAGELHPRETEMLKGVFSIDRLTAEEIMVPRARVDYIDRKLSLRDALTAASKTKHSKLPVVDGATDRVLGVLHTKDLFDVIQGHTQQVAPAVMVVIPNTVRIDKLIRKVYRIKPNMVGREILDGMRKRNVQIAIVQTDDGKAVGIVCMEDIVERLVGDINDEHDKPAPNPPPSQT